jgi:hypothetical protein
VLNRDDIASTDALVEESLKLLDKAHEKKAGQQNVQKKKRRRQTSRARKQLKRQHDDSSDADVSDEPSTTSPINPRIPNRHRNVSSGHATKSASSSPSSSSSSSTDVRSTQRGLASFGTTAGVDYVQLGQQYLLQQEKLDYMSLLTVAQAEQAKADAARAYAEGVRAQQQVCNTQHQMCRPHHSM